MTPQDKHSGAEVVSAEGINSQDGRIRSKEERKEVMG
jgi:hypothetical protein